MTVSCAEEQKVSAGVACVGGLGIHHENHQKTPRTFSKLGLWLSMGQIHFNAFVHACIHVVKYYLVCIFM